MNKNVGYVLELFISKKDKSKRLSQTKVELDKNGIVGDKFYALDTERSILLTSTESYELALENGIKMPYGALGENILIDYYPYELITGTQLKIGNVILEITQNCTICNHLSSIDKCLPRLLKNNRGIFVKVIKDGYIKKDDAVCLLPM